MLVSIYGGSIMSPFKRNLFFLFLIEISHTYRKISASAVYHSVVFSILRVFATITITHFQNVSSSQTEAGTREAVTPHPALPPALVTFILPSLSLDVRVLM